MGWLIVVFILFIIAFILWTAYHEFDKRWCSKCRSYKNEEVNAEIIPGTTKVISMRRLDDVYVDEDGKLRESRYNQILLTPGERFDQLLDLLQEREKRIKKITEV